LVGKSGSRKEQRGLPVISQTRCKACGICVRFCPRKALQAGAGDLPYLASPEECNACRECERLCPDFAIELVDPPAGPAADSVQMTEKEICQALTACED
jgi:2-oxoglutarate ferredoxin oxidoreductase subunit delta